MRRVYFKNMRVLAAFMFEEAAEKESVMAVFHYDKAVELLHELAKYDEIIPHSIHLEPEDWDGYSKEYYITLSADSELSLYIEQAYNREQGIYLGYETDCLILDGDASSQIARKNMAEHACTYEAVFEEDDVGREDCDMCACCCGDEEEFEDDDLVRFDIGINDNHYSGTIPLLLFLEMFKD